MKTRPRIEPATIRAMFDDIAPTYDLLNHLLSAGMDIRWRNKAVRLLEPVAGGHFLDIAAGSGDVALTLLAHRAGRVVALDFAGRMLEVFRDKVRGRGWHDRADLVGGNALALPFAANTFDATIVAFGIRNFSDRPRALREMMRVLKPSGRSVILELSIPSFPLASQLYDLYARIGLPLIGRLISRHTSAYRYLPESIAAFPDRLEFERLMAAAGFKDVRSYSLSFGSATIFMGRRPA